MEFMSWVSRVWISLSLIAVAVIGIHVMSVESNAKINIGVNGICCECPIKATCHFLFDHASKRGLKQGKMAHLELKLYYKRQAVSHSSEMQE